MSKKLWEVRYEDTPGGIYMRRVETGRYHFIEWTDMDDVCGRDNEGHPKYCVTLKEVDLDAIPATEQEASKECCDYASLEPCLDTEQQRREAVADACYTYGAAAFMWEETSNNLSKLVRAAKKESRELDDPNYRTTQLQRPVNGIGSTALELMQGDIFSAMARGVAANTPEAKVMAKMYGVPSAVIEDHVGKPAPPVSFRASLKKTNSNDPIAFISGYGKGLAAGVLETGREEISPEYIRGYQVGVSVRVGEVPVPHCFGGPLV